MSTLELNLYQMLKTDLKISDERARQYVEVIEGIQELKLKEVSNEYRSIFKEDIYKVESNLKQEIKNDASALRNEMSINTKWIVGLIFGLAIMIVGLYIKK